MKFLSLFVIFFSSVFLYAENSVFSFVVDLPQNATSQVFYDIGDGINEEDSTNFPLKEGTNFVEIEIPSLAVKQIRIDPMNDDGEFHIVWAKLRSEDGETVFTAKSFFDAIEALNQAQTLERENSYIYSAMAIDNDPYILLKLTNKTTWDILRRKMKGASSYIGVIFSAFATLIIILISKRRYSKKNKKFNTISLLYYASILIVSAIIAAFGYKSSVFFPATYCEIEMKSPHLETAQLFYDTGKGFRTSESTAFLTVNTDGSFFKYRLRLPTKIIYSLRFDPLQVEGEFHIRSIKLSTINAFYKWRGGGIKESVNLTQNIKAVEESPYYTGISENDDPLIVFNSIKKNRMDSLRRFISALIFWLLAFIGGMWIVGNIEAKRVPYLAFRLRVFSRIVYRFWRKRIVSSYERFKLPSSLARLLVTFRKKWLKLIYSLPSLSLFDRLTPLRVFIILAIVFGCLLSIFKPPYTVPDEQSHFLRAYQISDGHIKKEWHSNAGGYFPRSLVVTLTNTLEKTVRTSYTNTQNIFDLSPYFSEKLNANDKVFLPENRYWWLWSVPSHTIPYLPQALGMFVGRLLNQSPLTIFYFGRFANLIVYIFLISLAISIIPFHKWLVSALALMPTSLMLASSLSYDTLLIASSVLLYAILMRLIADNKERLTILKIAAMSTLSFFIFGSKYIYGAILLLFAFIPVKRSKTFLRHSLYAVIFLAFISFAYVSASKVSSFASPDIPTVEVKKAEESITLNYHATTQLIMVKYKPFNFVKKIFSTISVYKETYLEQLVGISHFYVGYIIFLLLLAIFSAPKRFMPIMKGGAFVIFSFSTFAAFVAMYVYASEFMGKYVSGFQGRYILPVLLPLMFVFSSRLLKIPSSKKNLFVLLYIVIQVFFLMVAMVELYLGYFA